MQDMTPNPKPESYYEGQTGKRTEWHIETEIKKKYTY